MTVFVRGLVEDNESKTTSIPTSKAIITRILAGDLFFSVNKPRRGFSAKFIRYLNPSNRGTLHDEALIGVILRVPVREGREFVTN